MQESQRVRGGEVWTQAGRSVAIEKMVSFIDLIFS